MSKEKILILLSEVLAARALKPVIDTLRQDTSLELLVINDGFGAATLDQMGIDYQLIEASFEEEARQLVEQADLVLSGKSYREPSENTLMRLCRELDTTYLMLIPDMGGQIGLAKFSERLDGQLLLPTKILITDPATHTYMQDHGIDPQAFIEVGNPHFDGVYERVKRASATANETPVVTYLDCPFELDYERGILRIGPYSQGQFLDGVMDAIRRLGQEVKFQIKKHGQSNESHFERARSEGIPFVQGDCITIIANSDVAVSSYSTTLLDASIADVPGVSYQPWPGDTIRADVFESRVPIAKNKEELQRELSNALERFGNPRTVLPLNTYHPENGVESIVGVIYNQLERRKPIYIPIPSLAG
ncbi:hypothetical protein GOV09_05650 [Candidatus Woesearchaeota archaeon]|nr:hypothetical protein [Candidatus Woesearchaeota archaeon]